MKSPTISVIMSVYNDETFVEMAIISLLVQTFSDFEVIIIDDGSSDNTAELIERIKDPRIVLIKRQNSGLTKSLNYALSQAKGKWIARQDADDMSIYTRFEQQIEFLEKHPDIKLLGTSQFVILKYNLVNEVFFFPTENEGIRNALLSVNPFVHGSVMIDRELLKKNGGYNERYRYVQDYELWTRLVPQTRVHNLSVPLYIRTIHEECSQISVDKEPIFQEIKDQYLKSHPCLNSKHISAELPIQSKSIYPGVPHPKFCTYLLSKHYLRMSQEARKRGMSWYRLLLNSLLYCPWAFLLSDKPLKSIE